MANYVLITETESPKIYLEQWLKRTLVIYPGYLRNTNKNSKLLLPEVIWQ